MNREHAGAATIEPRPKSLRALQGNAVRRLSGKRRAQANSGQRDDVEVLEDQITIVLEAQTPIQRLTEQAAATYGPALAAKHPTRNFARFHPQRQPHNITLTSTYGMPGSALSAQCSCK